METSQKKVTLSLDDFYLLSVIGKGSYAKVLLVKKKDTGTLHALKVLKKDMIQKRKQEEHIKVERNVLVSRPSSSLEFLIIFYYHLSWMSFIRSLLSYSTLFKTIASCSSRSSTALEASSSTSCSRESFSQKTSINISGLLGLIFKL
mgnify:FL=1